MMNCFAKHFAHFKFCKGALICGSLALILGLVSAHADTDYVADLESPVTTSPARWILISGTALTLGVLATQDGVSTPFDQDLARRKPLGSAAKFGDLMGQMVPNALYIGGMAVASYAGSPLGYFRAKLMFEATLYSALITTVLKYTIREPRPGATKGRDSFPSGHATTAFAFAGAVAAEHGWWYGAPAMALASFVAYSRINDGQHHLQDVMAGATIGLSCAYGIYSSHKDDRQKILANFDLMPAPIPGGVEVSAHWTY